jgi:hypothetical protein
MRQRNIKIIFLGLVFLLAPLVDGADFLGQGQEFFVEAIYDEFTRNTIIATLRKISPKAYFYFDDQFWNALDADKQTEILRKVDILAEEFEQRIYPTLSSNFGSEWSPGIDQSEKITILAHSMSGNVGGYFDSSDEYSKLQIATSNEREMIYLNSQYIDQEIIKSYLAHEFTHLITFNQKDVTYDVSEEVWLNESRAEYVSTLLGYDEDFEESNLKMRVQEFLINPSDSLTEWRNQQADYGVISMFAQYLTDHYGIEILTDSIKSSEVGISSLEHALTENGFSQNFSQIFTDWAVAVLVNDCSLGEKYCYKNPNLGELFVMPLVNYLPLAGKSSLSVSDYTKEWAGNWLKIAGGKGILKLEFFGEDMVDFYVPYVIEKKTGQKEIGFLELDENQDGLLYVEGFNSDNTSLVIIPSAQTKKTGFSNNEPAYKFSFTVSTVEEVPGENGDQNEEPEDEEAELIKKLLLQIAYLQKEIALVQAKINTILAERQEQQSSTASCQKIEKNLYYGLQNDSQVKCLQEFLKSQGAGIYPEGLITGNFFSLTKQAVIRFQASKGIIQTGHVGPLTRTAINVELGR